MSTQKPPVIAQSIVRSFAGPDLNESVLGDMQEKYQQQDLGSRWYWLQSLGSIPSFMLIHLHALGRRDYIRLGFFISITLALMSVFEIHVARQYSWPIAKHALSYSPLSVGNTCRAIYILLYSSFAVVIMLGLTQLLKLSERGEHFCKSYTLIFSVVVSLPIFYLLVFPLSMEGSYLFRIAQLLTVWLLLIVVALSSTIFISKKKSTLILTE